LLNEEVADLSLNCLENINNALKPINKLTIG